MMISIHFILLQRYFIRKKQFQKKIIYFKWQIIISNEKQDLIWFLIISYDFIHFWIISLDKSPFHMISNYFIWFLTISISKSSFHMISHYFIWFQIQKIGWFLLYLIGGSLLNFNVHGIVMGLFIWCILVYYTFLYFYRNEPILWHWLEGSKWEAMMTKKLKKHLKNL